MYLIFTKRDTLISDAIAAATNSPYSHVAVLHSNMQDVTEARGDGDYSSVIGNTFERIMADNDLTKLVLLEPPFGLAVPTKQSDAWLFNTRGIKYDFFNTLIIQPITLLRSKIASLFGRESRGSIFQRNNRQAKKKVQCGEYAAWWCKLHVKGFNQDVVIGHTSPASLYKICIDAGWKLARYK